MMMKNIILFVALFSVNILSAQIDMVAFGSRAAVVTNMYNPAIPLEGELCFNLPGLTSYSLTGMSTFAPKDAITAMDGYKFLDVAKIVSNLSDENIVNLKADTDPFYFGFHTKNDKGFISFGYGHYIEVASNLSRDFLTYIGNGNADFIDQTVRFDNERLGFNHYQKYYAGYAHHINPKVTVGGRLNIYGGLNNFELKAFDASVFTDGNSFPAYATTASLALDARMGGMIAQLSDKEGSYSFKNSHAFVGMGGGFGVDLGVQYHKNENWKFTTSIKDIGGFINWKENYGRKIALIGDGEISFEGIEANLNSEDIKADVELQFDDLEAELNNDFELNRVASSYKSKIRSSLLVSAHYKTTSKKHEFIGMFHTRDKFGNMFNQAGLTYHFSPYKWVQLSAGYSWMKEAPLNLGTGMTIAVGALQFNVFTNHLPGFLNTGNVGQASVRGGFNAVWKFEKETKSVEEQIEEVKETTPNDTKKYF